MLHLIKQLKVREVSNTSHCGTVTWTYPIKVDVILFNPFNPKGFVRPWCSKIRAGGFHFCGLRVTWGRGKELKHKRIVRN